MSEDAETKNWLNSSLGFWLQWTVGSIIGCVLGCLAGLWLGSIVLAVLAIGLCTAGVQAAILSRHVRSRTWRWVLFATLAWPLSIGAGYVGGIVWFFAFGPVVINALGPWPPELWLILPRNNLVGLLESTLLFAPGGGIAGVVYGALQWPAVRQPGFTRRGWLATHAVSGLALVFAFFQLLVALVEGNASAALTIAALGGATYGILTGLPLSKMLAPGRR